MDSHTHIVFAGSRSDEFARRLRGESYQRIAAEGGGILRTMNAVRAASQEEIEVVGRRLAHNAMRHGTTTIEIKSGYGLTLESELKLLRAARTLKAELPIRVITTFLGAHDFPPEYSNNHEGYINLICNEISGKSAGVLILASAFPGFTIITNVFLTQPFWLHLVYQNVIYFAKCQVTFFYWNHFPCFADASLKFNVQG